MNHVAVVRMQAHLHAECATLPQAMEQGMLYKLVCLGEHASISWESPDKQRDKGVQEYREVCLQITVDDETHGNRCKGMNSYYRDYRECEARMIHIGLYYRDYKAKCSLVLHMLQAYHVTKRQMLEGEARPVWAQ